MKRMNIVGHGLAVLFGLALLGCGQPGTESRRSAPPAAPDEEEKLEQLRSLPYLSNVGIPKLGAGKGVKSVDRAHASPGYTLVVFAGTCTAQLLSMDGEVVRSWTDAPCHRWDHAELLPDGDLIVIASRLDEDVAVDPIETGRSIVRFAWDGRVVWRRELNAHHDLSVLPDGNFLTLVFDRRRLPAIDPDNDVADDVLTLLSPEGKVLESVSLYDVLASSSPPFPIQKAGTAEHGHRLIDLFHCNAIRPASVPKLAGAHAIYGPHAVLVTSRHQDELLIIDWKTRKLLWHWGRGVLSGPHEASMLEDGHVLVFDNGLSRGWSRVLDFDPLAPERLVQFSPGPTKFFSRVMGSCQRLPNGNTLIVHSEGGAAFELTPQGAPAWIYEGTQQTPDGHRVKLIRARRIPAGIVDAMLKAGQG